jgi:hypothetical protein
MARMSVKNGRLVLPDGMSYRLLVLPANSRRMTPALAKKIQRLVAAGATVFGPSPMASPSLSDYPTADAAVAKMAAAVWGDCDGQTVTEHTFGQGRVIWGRPLETVLANLRAPADFTSSVTLNWIHRQAGDTQIYFVANERNVAVEAQCDFRVKDLRPELWQPETGDMAPLAVYQRTVSGVSVPLRLEPSGSCFVVFRSPAKSFDPVVRFTRNDEPVIAPARPPRLDIQTATYGVPGDSARTRDVRSRLQAMADSGEVRFQVAKLAAGDDPAYGIVKTLTVQYTVNGRPATLRGQDPDTVSLVAATSAPERAAEIRCNLAGKLTLIAARPGIYELRTARGKIWRMNVASAPAPFAVAGPWNVRFPPRWGAPPEITLDHLISLSDSPVDGVKFFSGTATYTTIFDWIPPGAENQPTESWLDLGDVQVMARVKLNGHDLGIVWKSPFRVNVSAALQPGRNALEVEVADLWPNRMIGDAALPAAKRFTWSSYEPFTQDSPLPKSGLLGPVTIHTSDVFQVLAKH